MTARSLHDSPDSEWGFAPTWVAAGGIFVLTILVYFQAIPGGYLWDDETFVRDNMLLRTWQGLNKIWFEVGSTTQYYPLAYTSFWLEYQVWGLNPAGSHLVNVTLHALNVCLVWLVLWRLEVPGAVWAALIFAVHPVMVESVAWITERKNVLSTAFYLLTLLACLRWFRLASYSESKTAAQRVWLYALILVLFVSALACKTVVCTLPAVLVLLIWWKRGHLRWSDLSMLGPLFVLGLYMGLHTAQMEKHVVGAVGQEWSLSFGQRLLLAGRAFWFYLDKLALPVNLMFFYPRWQLNTGIWWQWLFPISALGLFILLVAKRAVLGKGPMIAGCFYAGTLFPALGFFDVFPFRYSFVADHFQYLASLGPIALAGAGVASLANGRYGRENYPLIMGSTLCLFFGFLSWNQGAMYRDLETLYRTTLKRNPQSIVCYNNLSQYLLQAGRVSEAKSLAEKALEISPHQPDVLVNLGNALVAEQRLPEAIERYEQALAINSGYPEAHSNLGNVLLYQGQLCLAESHYRQAIKSRPRYAEAHNNLGFVLSRQDKITEAIQEYRLALEIKPNYDQARINLEEAEKNSKAERK